MAGNCSGKLISVVTGSNECVIQSGTNCKHRHTPASHTAGPQGIEL